MRCSSQTLAFVGFLVIMCIGACMAGNRDWPPGVNSKTIPAPVFDDDAPLCSPREACGFYSFTLKTRALRWIKSWCKCSDEQECVYDKTDTKMRVYRQSCRNKSSLESPEQVEEEAAEQYQEAQLNQEQEHLLASSRKRRAMMILRNLH